MGIVITFEEAYAIVWKRDAMAEGHRKRLPISPNVNGAIRRNDVDNMIVKSVQKGNTSIASVMADTGLGKHIVEKRLRSLGQSGKIVKVGHQWRVK